MATIDDFGGTNDLLSGPALGGPGGWANAVRDAIVDLQENGGGGGGGGAPLGTVVAHVGSEAPEGWHICDGSPHGSAPLEALIGSPNTPDLRGRFLLAASAGRPAGQTGGAETHTLTASEMPVHNHGMNAEATEHTHSGHTGSAAPWPTQTAATSSAPTATPQDGNVVAYGGRDGTLAQRSMDIAPAQHGHPFTTGGRSAAHIHGIHNAGSGAAHNNMPPFYAIVYIIKTFTDVPVGQGFTREEATAQFVDVTGDTMTGPLSVLEPVEDAHATTKGYVDAIAGAGVKIVPFSQVLGTISAGATAIEGTVNLAFAGFTAPPIVVVNAATPFNAVTWACSTRGATATSVVVRAQGAASPGESSFAVSGIAIGV